MGRRVEIFLAYLGQLLKAQMEYRLDFLVDVTTTMLRQGVDLAFLAILFTKVPRLAGWSFPEVVFIYGFFTLVFGLYNATFLSLISDFADRYLIRAELDRVLTRPLGSLYQVFLERLRPLDLNGIVLGAALMVYAALRLDLAWGLLEWALLVPLVLGGFLVYSGFFLAITSINFWFEVRGGIAGPFMNLSRFGRYPVTIYGPGLRALLSTAVPFAFIAFYPSALLLGRREYLLVGLATPVVGLALFAVAVFIWRRGIAHYESAGS
jgi:ABC-2 type transport system permease protein